MMASSLDASVPNDPLSPSLPQTAAAAAPDVLYPILVSNISPAATAENLQEFFSFCGPVAMVDIAPDVSGGVQQGTVSFTNVTSAETALLLDAALIVDRPICIQKVPDATKPSGIVEPGEAEEQVGPDSLHSPDTWGSSADTAGLSSAQDHAAPAAASEAGRHSSSAYTALSGLLGAGYRLGQQALDYVAEFEERHGYKAAATDHICAGLAAVQAKVREVDEQHAISEKIKVRASLCMCLCMCINSERARTCHMHRHAHEH